MATDRVHRILRLIVLLQGRQALGTPELMEHLGVSRRTLFRDLKMLELAGIPYYHEKGRGFRIGRGFFLPPVNLTAPESLALMLLAKATPLRRTAPLGQATQLALSKFIATVPQEIREACHEMLANVSVDHGAQLDQPGEAEHYVSLQQCIDECRSCRVTYDSPAEPQPLAMRLEPYALHFAARAWYVVGFCDLYQEVRTLKLGRIRSLEMTDRLFVRPASFRMADRLGKAWQLIPEGKIYRIELEFSARVARNVTETRWHSSQDHVMLPDGRCRMTFEVDGLGEIAWWVCGYADQVKVVAPAALRQRVVRMLSQALDQYQVDLCEDQAESEPTVIP